MKLFVTLCVLLSVLFRPISAAATTGYYYPLPAAAVASSDSVPLLGGFASSLVGPIQQQYHSQDGFGQYSYGYSEPLSSKQEVRTLDGVTRGSYSYRDANGEIQTVDYIADAGGFRAAATNLPRSTTTEGLQSVAETPEVAAARAQHLAAYKEIEQRLAAAATHEGEQQKNSYLAAVKSASSIASPVASEQLATLPRPVGDTAEVAAAKVEFFKRYELEQQRHQQLKHKLKQQKTVGFTVLRAAAAATSPQHFVAAAPLSLSYQPVVLSPNAAALRFANQLVAALPQRAYLPTH